ncbi:MAG: RAMP superfamily CRISPR-associated protein [Thermofilaceae archaeon]
MQPSLSVVRRKPKDRSRLEGLAGRLQLALRACSRRVGDEVDSYLYVGSGFLRLAIEERLLAKARQARVRRELEAVVAELSKAISLDHQPFSATARGLVVPASSVKGNVRSRLELSFARGREGFRSCFIRASGAGRPPARGQQGWRHYRIWEESLREERGSPCDCTGGWEECEVCLLCDLFGTAGLQGLVSFSDFVGERVETERLNLPTGEKLEAVKPGSVFKGSVTFRSLEPVELGLLLYGMGLRDSRVGKPVLLGKLKYRRDLPHVFGVVRYELQKLELAPFSQPLKVDGLEIPPGGGAEGEVLGRLVAGLVKLVRTTYGGELLDVDEVGAVERLEA